MYSSVYCSPQQVSRISSLILDRTTVATGASRIITGYDISSNFSLYQLGSILFNPVLPALPSAATGVLFNASGYYDFSAQVVGNFQQGSTIVSPVMPLGNMTLSLVDTVSGLTLKEAIFNPSTNMNIAGQGNIQYVAASAHMSGALYIPVNSILQLVLLNHSGVNFAIGPQITNATGPVNGSNSELYLSITSL